MKTNIKKLVALFILIIIIIVLLSVIIKPKSMSNTETTVKVTENVAQFETPASYELTVPAGYAMDEIGASGTDSLIGVSGTTCIHKEGTKADPASCIVSITSIPDKMIKGSVENFFGLLTSNKITFAGTEAFEFAVNGEYSGYRIGFYKDNHRIYTVTAILDKSVVTLEEARNALSVEQKQIIDSFKFI